MDPSTPAEPEENALLESILPSLPWPDLHKCEVVSATMQARLFAACGPDEIPNHALQLLMPALLSHLVPLYRALLALSHLSQSWRDISCVVLRKPKKPDYRDLKAYQLMAFERCTAKGLEHIVAAQLAHFGKSYGMLPSSHFGGRRPRSAEDAVVCVVDEIKRQWRVGSAVIRPGHIQSVPKRAEGQTDCQPPRPWSKFDSSRSPLCSRGKDKTREHVLLNCSLYNSA